MDWPHDPDGEEGSEGGRKYGLAILAKKLDEEEDFPLSRDEFVEAHADEPVRINYRKVVSVDDIFDHVDQAEFDDIVDFHQSVGEAMRRGGFWDYHPKGEVSENSHI
ncbi:DUF5785 family protein [Halomicrococcus sp. NG-SE-24]|uniref:DUF5785 family protein n=1 Tax=Halomicrococcus sp. NG-SE-24 TaxID=3436928 RepID=UPI003D997717